MYQISTWKIWETYTFHIPPILAPRFLSLHCRREATAWAAPSKSLTHGSMSLEDKDMSVFLCTDSTLGSFILITRKSQEDKKPPPLLLRCNYCHLAIWVKSAIDDTEWIHSERCKRVLNNQGKKSSGGSVLALSVWTDCSAEQWNDFPKAMLWP